MLQSLLLIIFSLTHAFYVSVTEINQNQSAKTLEISSRIFLADFEQALEKEYRQKVDLTNPANKKQVEQMVAGYLSKHLVLNVNGKPVSMMYIGYEIEDDGAWCYFEVRNISAVNRLQIKNDILFNYYPDQVNMMHVTVKGNRKSIKLNNPASQASLDF